MPVDVKIPEVGESISEALVSRWLKSEGDRVAKDEPLVELETDKVAVELPAPEAGVLVEILVQEGKTVPIGEVIARLEPGDGGDGEAEETEEAGDEGGGDDAEPGPRSDADEEGDADDEGGEKETEDTEEPDDRGEARGEEEDEDGDGGDAPARRSSSPVIMPAAQRLLEEHDLEPHQVAATGPGGRMLKEDVERHLERHSAGSAAAETASRRPAEAGADAAGDRASSRREEVVPMSPIRRRIAERLVSAQQNAALLSTFNEIDMTAVVELRQRYKETFLERWEVKLGFMSFFVRAAVDALRAFPGVNAEIRGTDIVYRDYCDIGIAVSTDRGLLVPILRNAERLGFAEIEQAIGDFGERARDGKIKLDELEGGTFTISNGGVFGSLLSTPIVNPPQSGVLGLHAIEDRPVARDGEVVIRPMMYVALSYDHRIVDGREAVGFLKRIKDTVEDPTRLLLEV